jgi:hypothetical protein
MGLRPWDALLPGRDKKRPVLVSPAPGRGRSNWVASAVSPRFRLSKCAARQLLPPSATHPQPPTLNSTDLTLAWEEGGRLASGSRGPWSREVQGTPSSHHSSSAAVLLCPRISPSHPQARRASSRDTRLATFRFYVTTRPPLRFHEGRWPGRTGYTASGRRGGGGGGPGRGPGCRAHSSTIVSCPRTWARLVGCRWQT